MSIIQREGIDHDPIQPWMLATLPRGEVVEILSYPIPVDPDGPCPVDADEQDAYPCWTVMIRTTPGNPSTLREAPLNAVACFNPDRYGTPADIRAAFPMWTGVN